MLFHYHFAVDVMSLFARERLLVYNRHGARRCRRAAAKIGVVRSRNEIALARS